MSQGLIEAIGRRRKAIQRQIDEEEASGHPHWQRLARLKKLRLRLKDRLTQLTAGPAHAAAPPPRPSRPQQIR